MPPILRILSIQPTESLETSHLPKNHPLCAGGCGRLALVVGGVSGFQYGKVVIDYRKYERVAQSATIAKKLVS